MASEYYWYRIPLQINLPLQWMLMSEVSWIRGSCKGWRTSASTCCFLVLINIRKRTNSTVLFPRTVAPKTLEQSSDHTNYHFEIKPDAFKVGYSFDFL
ncbi:hypothetical protein COOONC_01184 [Cooperia oncophora]